jgi:predicted glycosyltransferase
VVDVVPSDVGTAAFLRNWLPRSVVRERRRRHGIDLDGLDRVAERIRVLTDTAIEPPSARPPAMAAPTTVTDEGDQHVAV